MKRFYIAAAAAEDGRVLLDGKPVNTPARRHLALPTPALAVAVSAEWNAQGDTIAPATMKLTGLANAAIDRVAPDPAAFAATLARYAESDLLCYRADKPADLRARQEAEWDPLLGWARRRYDIDFAVTDAILHVPQPPLTVTRLSAALAALDPFRLAAMSPLVTIGGSLVAALALYEGEIDAADAFAATHLDELWQAEQWGADAEAIQARQNREADFAAAARFLTLLAEQGGDASVIATPSASG